MPENIDDSINSRHNPLNPWRSSLVSKHNKNQLQHCKHPHLSCFVVLNWLSHNTLKVVFKSYLFHFFVLTFKSTHELYYYCTYNIINNSSVEERTKYTRTKSLLSASLQSLSYHILLSHTERRDIFWLGEFAVHRCIYIAERLNFYYLHSVSVHSLAGYKITQRMGFFKSYLFGFRRVKQLNS